MSTNLIKIILSVMFYLSIFRATNTGLFYPSDENLLHTINYLPQTLTNISLLLLLVAYIFLSNNYKFTALFARNPLILFCLVSAVLTTAFSTDPKESIKFILAVTVVSVPSIIYAEVYGIKSLLTKLALFIAIVSFINLVYTLILPQYGIMSGNHAGRWKGMFEHKNYCGSFFAIGFFVVWNQIGNISFPLRWIALASLPVCLAFVALSGSATAYVLFALILFSYPIFLLTFRMHNRERAFIYILSLSAGLLMFMILGPFLSDFFFELTGRDATLTGRTDIWAGLMEAAMQRPIFGYGAGLSSRSSFMEQFHGLMGKTANSSHNTYIDLLLNYGFPIAIVIISIIFKLFFSGIFTVFRQKEPLRHNALAASLTLSALAIGFSAGTVIISRSIFWMYLLIGLLIFIHTRRQSHAALSPPPQQAVNPHPTQD